MSLTTTEDTNKWLHPNEVLKLQRLKLKKRQLQARINKPSTNSFYPNPEDSNDVISNSLKRRNPFLKEQDNKRLKTSDDYEESSDQTLFKLLHATTSNDPSTTQPVSFDQLFKSVEEIKPVEVVPVGKTWIPIDWSLKTKIRLMSLKPFAWSQKLKISEEASGITGFVRCLDSDSKTTLDTSANAKFHQCCLYWQQPYLPWLNLFPRSKNVTSTDTISLTSVRESLQMAWSDSLRSLYQLVRTCQCPYFYVCANSFTVLFRAVGICGFSDITALITPTTRGFRHLLKQEDIDFVMPLRQTSTEDSSQEQEEEVDDQWFESMGIGAEHIKQINYTHTRITYKIENSIDNCEESLVLIEGVEVQAFYNFLLNCKSCVSATGHLAGIPPTLLAPVAFNGATLCSLKVKESKALVENTNYFSLELNGPILPHVIHNLCGLNPFENNLTITFANINSTIPFSKVKRSGAAKENYNTSRISIFGQENLSDCGLDSTLLKHFCSSNNEHVTNIDSLKYNSETKTYIWEDLD